MSSRVGSAGSAIFLEKWFRIALQLLFILVSSAISPTKKSNHSESNSEESCPLLRLKVTTTNVVMDNGIIAVTLTNPSGSMAGIQFNGVENLLNNSKQSIRRGQWDIVWNTPNTSLCSIYDRLVATDFHVIVADDNQIEVSFTKTFDPRDVDSVPLNVDKRYVLQAARSGFYTYAMFDHPNGWPDVNIDQARISLNLKATMFNFMAISDDIQRPMPSATDRTYGSEPLCLQRSCLTNSPIQSHFQRGCNNNIYPNLYIPHLASAQIIPTEFNSYL